MSLARRNCCLAVFLLGAVCLAPVAALAQVQGSGEIPGQDAGGEAPTVQVGAGTIDATTTGTSGPQEPAGGGGPPPLPSAETCADFDGQPAYEACLQVVLAEEGEGAGQEGEQQSGQQDQQPAEQGEQE